MPHVFRFDEKSAPLMVEAPFTHLTVGDPSIRAVQLPMDGVYGRVRSEFFYLEEAAIKDGVVLPDDNMPKFHMAPRPALVVLSVPPPENGFVTYTSASYDEVEKKGRMERKYHPLPNFGIYDPEMVKEMEEMREAFPEKTEEECKELLHELSKVAGVTVLATGWKKTKGGTRYPELLVSMVAGSAVRVRKVVKAQPYSVFLLKWDRWGGTEANQWDWGIRQIPLSR